MAPVKHAAPEGSGYIAKQLPRHIAKPRAQGIRPCLASRLRPYLYIQPSTTFTQGKARPPNRPETPIPATNRVKVDLVQNPRFPGPTFTGSLPFLYTNPRFRLFAQTVKIAKHSPDADNRTQRVTDAILRIETRDRSSRQTDALYDALRERPQKHWPAKGENIFAVSTDKRAHQ